MSLPWQLGLNGCGTEADRLNLFLVLFQVNYMALVWNLLTLDVNPCNWEIEKFKKLLQVTPNLQQLILLVLYRQQAISTGASCVMGS